MKSDVGLYFKCQGLVGLPEKPYGQEHSLQSAENEKIRFIIWPYTTLCMGFWLFRKYVWIS